MKLIKKFKFLTLVAAVVAPSVFADTTAIVAPFVRGDGESYGSDVYTAYSFKTKADYAIASELLWRLSKSQIDDANPATDDPWDSTKINHRYFRITITDPGSIDLGSDWKVGFSYRYYVPTGSSDQLAGSYGSVGFRPWVAKDFGLLNLKLRSGTYLYLQRNHQSENVPAGTPGATSTGNSLASTNLELLPQFDFMESSSGSFYFLAYAVVAFKYVMAPAGGEATWSNAFEITPEIGYTFKNFAGGGNLAIAYDETGVFGTDKTFRFFKKDQFEVALSWTQPL